MGNIQTPIEGGGKIDKKAKREARANAQHEAAMKEDTGDDAADASGTPVEKEHKQQREKKDEKGTHKKKNKKHDNKDKKDKKEKKEKKAKKPDDVDDVGDEKKEGEALMYGDKEVKALVNTLRNFNTSGNVSHEDFYEEMRMHQLANCFDHKLRLYITLEVVCGSTMVAKSVMENKNYISKIISQVNMPQADIIWAFNVYVHVNPDCLRGFAHVLKVLYDEDWAEEHTILDYYNDDSHVKEPGFEEARGAAAPFLKWLQVAEADDDDSEENLDE